MSEYDAHAIELGDRDSDFVANNDDASGFETLRVRLIHFGLPRRVKGQSYIQELKGSMLQYWSTLR